MTPSPQAAITYVRDATSPEVQLLGDAVVLRGHAAVEAYTLIARGVAAAERQDGIRPSGRTRLLMEAARAAASMSACPVADVRSSPTSASSGLRGRSRVGTQEAADMIGISQRQVRRLAESLGGRNSHGRWTYDAAAVQAAAKERT